MKQLLIITTALLLLTACGNSGKDENKERVVQVQAQPTGNYVDTMVLHMTDFRREVVCNGRWQPK